ncbi:glycosyltransferase [Pedobacter nyackensis]|uniref:glycosyltransferase n=1 Tax=Pedobacter nyackensis TaxID=475255 RepID=UPI00292D9F0D|nr:glycosyltransferase [Pedobacter nyackensis]
MPIDYSVIICTYNPDPRLIERCLNAVARLNMDHLNVEVILVDNNSTEPIKDSLMVKELLGNMNNLRLINELKQGLTSARLAGIKDAKGEVIVFFDDDNEPEVNYLQELHRLNQKHKHIAVWGPGNIWVDFVDGIDEDIEEYARGVFQERHNEHVAYANTREWQNCYPFGTGMCVKATYLKNYVELVNGGKLTLSDRKGNQLSSGGDVQIVLSSLKMGLGAGVSPGLKLNHIIPAKRANYDYIARLLYGVFIESTITTGQVFPEHYEAERSKTLGRSKFSKMAMRGYLKFIFNNNPYNRFAYIIEVAQNCGLYYAFEKPIPMPVQWIIRQLKLG